MKARLSHSGLALAVLALVTAVSASAAAQSKTGDRVMIPTLQSADKDLGGQAAEAIRSQLQKQTNVRDLVVVPKADIVNSLTSSGYSPTEALAPGDAKALATLVRAPQYLDGVVSKTPTGFKIDSRLVISRDMNRGQVLPSAQAAKLDDAASQVAKSIRDARRQLAGEETCHNAVAQGKYQDGVTAARSAMASYPTANIAGACLVDAYASLKMNDSVIAVAERIRASDPRNTVALRRLAEAYQTRNDTTNELKVLGALAAADPTNIKMVQDVVASFGQMGHAQDAVPLVRDLVQNNPGDPELLKLAYIVYLNAKDFPGAVNAGNELVRVDTAAGTADFYARLAGAYSAMGQKQKAAETAARGFAKFPGEPNLQLFNAQALYQSGQLQMALDAAKKAVAANNTARRVFIAGQPRRADVIDSKWNPRNGAPPRIDHRSVPCNPPPEEATGHGGSKIPGGSGSPDSNRAMRQPP